MSHFMIDQYAYPAVVDRRIGVGIEIWCLQHGGGQDDLAQRFAVPGIIGLRRQDPAGTSSSHSYVARGFLPDHCGGNLSVVHPNFLSIPIEFNEARPFVLDRWLNPPTKALERVPEIPRNEHLSKAGQISLIDHYS
jgi:hypothetical protein